MNEPLRGLLSEFQNSDHLVAAAKETSAAGYRELDFFSPFPIDELDEVLPPRKDLVAPVTFLGGLFGGVGGYFMQWYANVVDYPINVAGRPDHSWPAFIPVTFELTVLGAALSAAFGMIVMNRLPEIHHPVFSTPGFNRASKDRYFLFIKSNDPKFSTQETARFLWSLQPLSVHEVRDER